MLANVECVLIESDWNLNKEIDSRWLALKLVLIESDWNLNYLAIGDNLSLKDVLIESDWNLNLIICSNSSVAWFTY